MPGISRSTISTKIGHRLARALCHKLWSIGCSGLHFFGGLSPEETAEVLGVLPDTVFRDWRLAKAWLKQQMKRGRSGGY